MSKEFQIKDLKPMTSIKIPKELIGKGCRFISEEDYVEYLRMKETEYYVKQCGLKEKDQQIAELKQQLKRHNKYFNSFGCDSFDEFTDFISTFMLTPHEEQTLIKDLKKQLEEKEKMLEEYKKCNCKECMTDYEKNLNQIIDKYLYENNSLKQQVEKLKGDKK